jgi:RNA polymerase sigma-70 factor (ECF subfamily)
VTVEQAVDAAFRESWGRVVAALIRRTGNWDLAEECAQEAFVEALRRWPVDGVPDRPTAWLTTVAGNRAIDRLRREVRGTQLLEQIGRDVTMFDEPDEIEDDRLRLIFTCCHPALPMEGRVALTLRSLGGLSTAEIARAFLVPEATVAKRLTRTKSKISAAGIPYRVPPAHLLPERTAGVLAVLYLMFNEGYSDASRGELSAEAIRLTRSLAGLMPDEPEVAGALALMLLQNSRRQARTGAAGELVTLEEQDRSLWDRAAIDEGLSVLEAALRRGPAGPYLLQAAIAACHARAATVAETDWPQIAGLYDLLLQQQPTPVVRLNRAVAVAMSGDLDAGLAAVDELGADPRMDRYHLLEAVRADILRRRNDPAAALEAYRRALSLAPSEPERLFLRRRIREIGGH